MKKLILFGALFGTVLLSSVLFGSSKVYAATGTVVDRSTIKIGDRVFFDADMDDNFRYEEQNSDDGCADFINGFDNNDLRGNNTPSEATLTVRTTGGAGSTNCSSNEETITFTNRAGFSDAFVWIDDGTIGASDGKLTFRRQGSTSVFVSEKSTQGCSDTLTVSGGNQSLTLVERKGSNNQNNPGASAPVVDHDYDWYPFNPGDRTYNDSTSCWEAPAISNIKISGTPADGNNGGAGGADGLGGASASTEPTCESEGGSMSWIICPLLSLGDSVIVRLDEAITELLTVPSSYYESGGNLELAWSRIRNIAYLILVPVVMVMVIGTALGFDFISAYTVKRALPRLIAATIFIALSFEITTFLITFTNDVGSGIYGLIIGAIHGAEDITLTSVFAPDGYDSLVSAPIFVAGIAGAFAIGSIGIILSYLFIGVLGLAIGFFLLSLRQMLLIALLLLAPLAIIAWIFPGNDKMWKLWWGTFSKLLLLFPLIMVLIAVGKSFALLVSETDGSFVSTLLKLVAYVGPYFLIPSMFKFAGGMFATVSGMANDRGRGLFDRQKKYRQAKGAENFNKFKSGERYNERNKLAGGFNRLGQNLGTGVSGGFGLNAKGRGDIERMRTARQAEKMKEAGFQDALFDDDIREAIRIGNPGEAKTMLEGRMKAKYAKKVTSGEMTQGQADIAAAQDVTDKMGMAKSLGFNATTMAAALNFEAPNKSRNFVDRKDADGNVIETASQVMRREVSRVAKATGQDEDRLLQNYMYAAGTQGGRLELRSESVDKVIEEKFDTRLLQQSTAPAWEAITNRNLELLKTGSDEQKYRAGAQLLAMQDSLPGANEGSRQKFVELMSQQIDYTSSDVSIEDQLAGLASIQGQSQKEVSNIFKSTSSTYGTAREYRSDIERQQRES